MSNTNADESSSVRYLAGRYQLIKRITHNSVNEIWEAKDSLLLRPVGIKIPLEKLVRQEGFLERFRQEAVSAASLSHPNIVAIFDTGKDKEDAFIVMELVNGPSLEELLASRDPIPWQIAVVIVNEAAKAIGFAHRKGVIHRDIKPSNILFKQQGSVKVSDFGIARVALMLGINTTSARYLSPEQIKAEPITTSTDVYSLGLVLYEMITGYSPFDAKTEVEISIQQVNQTPKSFTELGIKVPLELEEVVMRSLNKNPNKRFDDAELFKKALNINRIFNKELSLETNLEVNKSSPRASIYNTYDNFLTHFIDNKEQVKQDEKTIFLPGDFSKETTSTFGLNNSLTNTGVLEPVVVKETNFLINEGTKSKKKNSLPVDYSIKNSLKKPKRRLPFVATAFVILTVGAIWALLATSSSLIVHF